MAARHQQQITLPSGLMASIKAIATDESMPPAYRLSDGDRLPQARWQEVCAARQRGRQRPDPGVNLALSFMNSGPSAYVD